MTQERTNFTKVKENFTCENCAEEVVGNGYTNHCPVCLYSLHVDIVPGDRAQECRSLMKPISLEIDGKGYKLIHQCLQCGHEKANKCSSEDNLDAYFESNKDNKQI